MEGKCSGARTNCAVSALVLGSPTPPASIAGAQHLWTSRSPTRRQPAVVGATVRQAAQDERQHTAVKDEPKRGLIRHGYGKSKVHKTIGVFGFQTIASGLLNQTQPL